MWIIECSPYVDFGTKPDKEERRKKPLSDCKELTAESVWHSVGS
ncbi:hypothetical protein GALL_334990 [mine drainage metagenome]|uniref:Uncharacterized protein n=1 Tax=mine drainage metagenome TaxID=410659 RepID=A0A1J5QMR3_9ZZZZ